MAEQKISIQAIAQQFGKLVAGLAVENNEALGEAFKAALTKDTQSAESNVGTLSSALALVDAGEEAIESKIIAISSRLQSTLKVQLPFEDPRHPLFLIRGLQKALKALQRELSQQETVLTLFEEAIAAHYNDALAAAAAMPAVATPPKASDNRLSALEAARKTRETVSKAVNLRVAELVQTLPFAAPKHIQFLQEAWGPLLRWWALKEGIDSPHFEAAVVKAEDLIHILKGTATKDAKAVVAALEIGLKEASLWGHSVHQLVMECVLEAETWSKQPLAEKPIAEVTEPAAVVAEPISLKVEPISLAVEPMAVSASPVVKVEELFTELPQFASYKAQFKDLPLEIEEIELTDGSGEPLPSENEDKAAQKVSPDPKKE